MNAAITVQDLHKTFKQNGRRRQNLPDVRAVDGISFEVASGEFFGLLGPNGAGKTTTIGILTTRVRPDGGKALIEGTNVAQDPVAVKRRIGVVSQSNNLDRSLTARENLLFHAEYFGIPRPVREKRCSELLETFHLTERADARVTQYSGGLAQRLKIARSLMHDPAILFLDEPTTGLDPQARQLMWELLRQLNSRGHTLFLTTHYMEEADQVCQRIAIMDQGRLLAMDAPERLKARVPGGYLVQLTTRPGDRIEPGFQSDLSALEGVVDVDIKSGMIRLYADKAEGILAGAMRLATDSGVMIMDAHVAEPSLENLFLHLTGRSLRE